MRQDSPDDKLSARIPRSAVVCVLGFALLAPGCKSMGTKREPPDQFSSNQAIAQASNERCR